MSSIYSEMRIKIRYIITVLIVTANLANASLTDDKITSTKKLLSISEQLANIASQQTVNYPEGKVRHKIDSLVAQVLDCEDLLRLALLCHGIAGSQSAENASYDGVFDYAMWRCAIQLSQHPGKDGESALVYLQPLIGRDGGPSLIIKDLIEAQRKLSRGHR